LANYDIITIGGGVAGAALAKGMADRGKRVLVVERETQFKDRVRGEWVAPWGVIEAKELGLWDAILAAGGHTPTFFATRAGPMPLPPRNVLEDCAANEPQLTIYHPELQEALLAEAENAGAEVRRGVKVRGVEPGAEPSVELDGGTVTARLVVGADGRNSVVRKWGAFEVQEDEAVQNLAGVLMENVPMSDDSSVAVFNPFAQQIVFLFPQGGGRVRGYFGSRNTAGIRLTGESDFQRFIDLCVETGAPAEYYDGAKQAGPLATFDGYDSWVEHPYKEGVALVGDAAATSDQTWGQGISISLRGARLLRDALSATDDWEAAGHQYADAAAGFYAHVRTAENWQTQVMMEPGPEADAIRAKVLPKIAMDPTILPDTVLAGPDLAPADEAARLRLFGD